MSTNEIISPHSFEAAKKHIQSFSSKTSPDLGLDRVNNSGGLFGLFDHTVTGAELNSLTGQIQNYLIRFNDLHTDFIKEFGQVYKALESLDKEYIPAILSAVKGAEVASNQAKTAQADIKKSIEAQKRIIDVLENHKEKLDRIEHLGDIDAIWKLSKDLERDLKTFKTRSENLKIQYNKLDASLKALQKFADGILDYEHLEDVDEMWNSIVSFETEVSQLIIKTESLMKQIESNTSSIEDIESKLVALHEYEHLKDIDIIWNDVESQREEITALKEDTDYNTRSIDSIKADISNIMVFKNDMEKQTHINQIDSIWENVDKNKKGIIQNNDEMRRINDALDERRTISEKIKERITMVERSCDAHQKSIDTIEQLEHLFEVDSMWTTANNNLTNIKNLLNDVSSHSQEIDSLQKQIVHERDEHIKEMAIANRKLNIAFYLIYGTGGLLLIETLLHFMRVM